MSSSELVNPLIVRALTVQEFTAARSAEIHSLVNASKAQEPRNTKHIRRRAVSHNPRQRQVSKQQLQKQCHANIHTGMSVSRGVDGMGTSPPLQEYRGDVIDTHNNVYVTAETGNQPPQPCRRARRRPCRLLSTPGTDQATNERVRRLETHLWHAKRMHMSTKWGCYIADTNAHRGERAAQKDVLAHCAVHDASYLRCLEVGGCVCELGRLFVSTPKASDRGAGEDGRGRLYTTTSVTAAAYSNTLAEGHTTLYDETGRRWDVSFAWKATVSGVLPGAGGVTPACSHRRNGVWLWIHPRDYDELYSVIKEAVNSNPLLAAALVVTDWSAEVGRISLYGPNAAQILASVLHADSLTGSHTTEDTRSTQALMKTLQSKTDQSITPLNVVDPRFYRHAAEAPDTSCANTLERETKFGTDTVSALVESSGVSLFDDACRRKASECKVSDKSFNAARSRFAIDRYRTLREHIAIAKKGGLQTDIYAETLPVLVVKRGGVLRSPACRTRGAKRNKGYGAGFDLIYPSGYGMPFWMALIYSGAHAFGQDLLRRLCLERDLCVLTPFNLTHDTILTHCERAMTTSEHLKAGDCSMTDRSDGATPRWRIVATVSKLQLANACVQQGCLPALKLASGLKTVEGCVESGDVVVVAVDMMHKGSPKADYLVYAPSAADYAAYTQNRKSCTFAANKALSTAPRQVMGVVAMGGYSYLRACGSGIAYISLERLETWGVEGGAYTFPAFVLVGEGGGRSPLRPAYVSVIMTAHGSTLT
ncbi:hypothetical protein SARC_05582 [Sphaeroforma arctica JP610]|uniref:Uncharacterized protein n=1 Tax=Sphaeroforma arctica JP610 TaxID=667725 RepID=A0A0L0FZ89_9EUKA|nr:hypothetical protein SARC_05582 [Sphaeroforma arctica JP610]KNC82130.1 hypothetical protein SARC_05582 [Sphaeroforma arctica JP610]|eukprot:XP_014156032.1 hypothetical protein SARC_05582 [Sphaeroforma arctica JP610]